MATGNDNSDSDPRDGINYKEIQSILKDQKTKGEKIKYLAGELGILADRFDSLNGKVFWLLSQHKLRGSTIEGALERLKALEGKQASQQAWCDNCDRVMALVESKVRKLQEAAEERLNAVEKRVTALLDEVAKLKRGAENHHERLNSVADFAGLVQDDLAALKNKHDGQTGYNIALSERITALEDAGKAAPALDPRLAKYLEAGGKYLLVEPADSAAGREWKAAVARETENDAPDEYGNAYAASPGEAVAALVAKLAKFKEP